MRAAARHRVLKAFYVCILSFFIAAADVYYHGGWSTRIILISKTFCYFILLWGFFYLSEALLTGANSLTMPRRWHRYFQYSKRNIIRMAALLFLIYLFYLLVFFPGTCGYDTAIQIADLVTGMKPMPFSWESHQVNVSALMNDHHPVTTTVIFTLFYRLGQLTGNASYGMFFYNIIQILFLSLLFATIICRMDLCHVLKHIALISLLFYASPVIAFYTITMIKDTLFSLVFVLYYMVFTKFVLTECEKENGVGSSWGKLILLSVLFSLMNKKGMYLAVFSNFWLILILKGKNRLFAMLSTVVPFFTVVILMGQVLFPLLNIFPGGKQEALGFTFQQTALSLIEHPESFTEEEKDVFFTVIEIPPDQLADRYDSDSTDAIKKYYRFDTSREQINTYLNMWFRHFFKTPQSYFRASLSVCGGYFAPVKELDVYTGVEWLDELGAFAQPEANKNARRMMTEFFNWFQRLPAIRVFSQDSLYYFWFPAFSLYVFAGRKQWKKAAILAPLAANILFLLMGPVCWTRYGLCQLYTFPVLLMLTAQECEAWHCAESKPRVKRVVCEGPRRA